MTGDGGTSGIGRSLGFETYLLMLGSEMLASRSRNGKWKDRRLGTGTRPDRGGTEYTNRFEIQLDADVPMTLT